MFKARKRNPKQKGAIRRSRDDDDDDDNAKNLSSDMTNDEEDATAETISRVKKKRKLLTELQYKKGTDAAALLKQPSVAVLEETAATAAAVGADSKKTTVVDETSSSQEGIMEQKHKQALERYVEEKLADMGGEKKDRKTGDDSSKTGKAMSKEELYQQLAQAAESLVGKKVSGFSGAAGGGGDGAAANEADGDVGAGGAMLVAGTGLAEVVLPVEERLKAVQATLVAASKGPVRTAYASSNYPHHGMPQSQVPVPGGASRFQVSAADRHRHYNNSSSNNPVGDSNKKQAPIATAAAAAAGNKPSSVGGPSSDEMPDTDRLGFEAMRGKASVGKTNKPTFASSSGDAGSKKRNKNRATDDKVYGNFVKHHRENQWRGR
jgi:hypothetical protein